MIESGDSPAQVRPFVPSWWAPGPHAQTMFARALRSSHAPAFARERIETPDGDFVDVDWGPDARGEGPIVLILHGLEGSTGRGYVRNVCRALLARGVRPVAMNFRGCSGEPNRALRWYHSGDTGDAAWLVDIIRDRHPQRAVGAIGFSLGGNVVLKMMGERDDGGAGLLDAAVAMSVPYDLAAGSALMERSAMGRAYTGYFIRSLRKKVASKADRLSKVLDLRAVMHARTIWEFDELATAPLNGFRDATDYYTRSSSGRVLSHIKVPTLLLHATNDPFLPSESIPVDDARDNPMLTLALQPGGGHVGFLAGTPWAPHFWGEEEGARFLAAVLDAQVL